MSDAVASRAEVLHQAHALIERRRYEQARAHLASALKSWPEQPDLLYLSAYVDYVTDQNASALRTIELVLRSQPEHAPSCDLYATLLEDEKRHADAERVRIQLLRDYPQDPDYYSSYAHLMLRTLNADKARRLAEEGLRFEPEHPGCLYAIALADLILGRSARDNAALAVLVRDHPEHARTAMALVIALQDRGDHRGALRIARELLRSRPDSPQYVALVRELRAVTHWSMVPLYPMRRWGWGGAIGVWIIGAFGLRVLSQSAPAPVVGALTIAWLAYIVYSWVWPPLLRKML